MSINLLKNRHNQKIKAIERFFKAAWEIGRPENLGFSRQEDK